MFYTNWGSVRQKPSIFYRLITLRRGLPFAVAMPNECTAATLEKSRRGEDVREFESLDAMFESWKK